MSDVELVAGLPEAYVDEPPAELGAGNHILEVRGLAKRFGRKVAVNGVDFSMKTGQITGLLGPNGAGKTTVFYMIVGFLRPTAGAVYLDHHKLSSLPMYRRARLGIAYLPQEPSVFRKMTVEENVRAILETRADLDRHSRRETLDRLLEEFGIADLQIGRASCRERV